MSSSDGSPPIGALHATPTADRGQPAAATPGRAAPESEATVATTSRDGGDGTGPEVPRRRRTEVHVPANLRRALLLHLRRDGPSTPDQLAGRIGASRTGVLQQLRALEAAHLVTKETIRHGVGRPRHVYDIAPEAQDLFPTNYEGLAAGLLAALDAVGGADLIEEVFAARRRQLGATLRQRVDERVGPNAPLVARVRELAVIQDEQGYLAEAIVGPDGVIRLREHNCAIYRVARANPAACAAELELFREVLGAEVERESHIAAGDRCCTYRITHRSDA
ncbi:MAG TPA: winged helix-turn-helix transcriptional regulator [Candidatus Binatia bacterium]|nr:winged helix-turn-helix transcriptional regulator [Candidatus Binatia bacterium]